MYIDVSGKEKDGSLGDNIVFLFVFVFVFFFFFFFFKEGGGWVASRSKIWRLSMRAPQNHENGDGPILYRLTSIIVMTTFKRIARKRQNKTKQNTVADVCNAKLIKQTTCIRNVLLFYNSLISGEKKLTVNFFWSDDCCHIAISWSSLCVSGRLPLFMN